MNMPTNKSRLESLLRGEIPDVPPHFELAFQLEQEAFGIKYASREELEKASPEERKRDAALHLEVSERLVDLYGWAAVYGDIAALQRAVGDRALVYSFNGEGTFWLMPGDDLMDFVVRLFEKPEELHEEARRKCDASIELAKRQVDAGADFICINSDYGYNMGPFISPKHFSEFVTPYLTEIVTAIHNLGVPAILHSDGNLNTILDQLVSTGLDGYQSVDPQGGMDIKSVRESHPNLLLMGNVECAMLQETDEAQIRKSVRYCMTHGGIGKRYVFSSSNCIFAGMPLESYRIMLDEYRSCCREACNKTI
jgi:uroporphyrinogen decarboxylase